MAQLRLHIQCGDEDAFVNTGDRVLIEKSFPDDLAEEASLDTQVDCFVNFLRAQGYDDLAIDNALQYGI